MTEKVAYLLLSHIESTENYNFSTSLETQLKPHLGESSLFSLDNHSDGMMGDFARKFLDESDRVIIICDQLDGQLGTTLSVLNYAVKRKNTKLLSIGEAKAISPFIKMMKGKVFQSREELIDFIKTLYQPS
jgi:hypothetical protein